MSLIMEASMNIWLETSRIIRLRVFLVSVADKRMRWS
jgi:hypothetical protein